MNRSLSVADWGLLLSASVLVGSTSLFANIAVQEISPIVVAALRAMISAVICWNVMRAYGARLPRTRQGWIALFWLGLLTGALPFGTMAWEQQHIDSGMGGILFGTMPILAAVLTPLLLAEEVFTRRALVGGMVGFAGIKLLMAPRCWPTRAIRSSAWSSPFLARSATRWERFTPVGRPIRIRVPW